MFLLILSGFNLTKPATQKLVEYGAGQMGYFFMKTAMFIYYNPDANSQFGILPEPIFSEFSVTPSIFITGRMLKDKDLSLWKTVIGVGIGSLIGTVGLYKYQKYVYGGDIEYGETGTEFKYRLIPVFSFIKVFLPSLLGIIIGRI